MYERIKEIELIKELQDEDDIEKVKQIVADVSDTRWVLFILVDASRKQSCIYPRREVTE